MMETIVYSILMMFVLIGVISTIYYVSMRLMCKKAIGKYVIVIPVNAELRDVAGSLCAANLRINLLGDTCRGRVIAVDCGMDESEKSICYDMCREESGMYICTPEELPALLQKEDF